MSKSPSTHDFRRSESREIKLCPFFDSCWPTGSDGLEAGVEVYGFRSVDIMVTEQRLFPSTKAMECNRYWNWDIYSDHTNLNFAHEIARSVTISSEDSDTVPIGLLWASSMTAS